jgi:hypothetical protein
MNIGLKALIVNAIEAYSKPVTNEQIIEFQGNRTIADLGILNSAGQSVFSVALQEKTVVQTNSFTAETYLRKDQVWGEICLPKLLPVLHSL